jgi:hypothetical protein
MNTPPTGQAQLTWNDARDACFFTITARLFSPQFCFGASTLLGTYDDDGYPCASEAPRAVPFERLAVHATTDPKVLH